MDSWELDYCYTAEESIAMVEWLQWRKTVRDAGISAFRQYMGLFLFGVLVVVPLVLAVVWGGLIEGPWYGWVVFFVVMLCVVAQSTPILRFWIFRLVYRSLVHLKGARNKGEVARLHIRVVVSPDEVVASGDAKTERTTWNEIVDHGFTKSHVFLLNRNNHIYTIPTRAFSDSDAFRIFAAKTAELFKSSRSSELCA
jgi:hypothetical protein